MAKLDIQQVKQRFGIIGNNPALIRAIDIALQVAPTDLSVLIVGESGTGKEVFPQIIHQNSQRKHNKYIPVNCGAIPEGTIDSELFGHEKGSFTGALSDRKGYFEEADGGTIFLDEVGELPMSTQARLLRVLESGEFMKVGSSKVLKTNVRIVAATNVNMPKAISSGKFREDLFYRLNTVPIIVPPLRDRSEDIILLFRKFASDFAEKYRMPAIQLSDDAKKMLVSYRWPGNIRQLKNITEQVSIIETTRDITSDIIRMYLPNYDIEKLPAVTTTSVDKDNKTLGTERELLYQVIFEMRKEVNELKGIVQDLMEREPSPSDRCEILPSPKLSYPSKSNLKPVLTYDNPRPKVIDAADEFIEEIKQESFSLQDLEKETIRKALERHNGKRKTVAQELKISERTLYRKIKEYNLD